MGPARLGCADGHPGSSRCPSLDELVDVGRRDHGGRTALFWAVSYGHVSVVAMLLERHASPEAKSPSGQTPVSVAKSHGRYDLVNQLMYYANRKVSPVL